MMAIVTASVRFMYPSIAVLSIANAVVIRHLKR